MQFVVFTHLIKLYNCKRFCNSIILVINFFNHSFNFRRDFKGGIEALSSLGKADLGSFLNTTSNENSIIGSRLGCGRKDV